MAGCFSTGSALQLCSALLKVPCVTPHVETASPTQRRTEINLETAGVEVSL